MLPKPVIKVICAVLGVLMIAGILIPTFLSSAQTIDGVIPSTGVDGLPVWIWILGGVAVVAVVGLLVAPKILNKNKDK